MKQGLGARCGSAMCDPKLQDSGRESARRSRRIMVRLSAPAFDAARHAVRNFLIRAPLDLPNFARLPSLTDDATARTAAKKRLATRLAEVLSQPT